MRTIDDAYAGQSGSMASNGAELSTSGPKEICDLCRSHPKADLPTYHTWRDTYWTKKGTTKLRYSIGRIYLTLLRVIIPVRKVVRQRNMPATAYLYVLLAFFLGIRIHANQSLSTVGRPIYFVPWTSLYCIAFYEYRTTVVMSWSRDLEYPFLLTKCAHVFTSLGQVEPIVSAFLCMSVVPEMRKCSREDGQ